MTTLRYLDENAVTAALAPAAAVDAITAALTHGYDPAADTARTSAATRKGHFLLMPSEVGDHVGVKVATVAPDNPAIGQPRIQAVYLAFNAATLTLQALLDGTALTTLRTPAVSIAAIRPALQRFTRALRVVVFGAGPQAIGHVRTLAAVTKEPLASVTFIVRTPATATAAHPYGQVVRADTPAANTALSSAHVVICATSARTPLFPADAISAQTIVIAVGSHQPDARELDSALLAKATVIVEDIDTALREAGDIILAHAEGALHVENLIPMKGVIDHSTTIPEDRPVVFKSVGMSWQDLVIATAVLESHTPAMKS
ncbi:ornithine cyclodeaminase (plasmid) [Arthrobacter sp. MN05-02]|nr:ornithine cyclodeaminase [Arthrobacter sp. MN05-02]